LATARADLGRARAGGAGDLLARGTLTKDGSPRVTPVEAYILDGHLVSNMIPRSLKALDLLRDPRVYVHGEGGEPGRAERAAWVAYDGEGQTQLVWKPGADGEKRLYKPGI
jgi:hypothetical protein